MSCAAEYWIWLQTALGAGADVSGLINYYGDAERVYNALCLRDLNALVSPAVLRRLSSVSPSQSYRIQRTCKENGWHIITPDSPFYSDGFRVLDNMPLVLYVNGDPSLINEKLSIGFVGTRLASVYGKRAAEKLSYSVAAAGVVIVSGCALGIDSCSHLGALEAKGKTVAYLGTGLDADYPKSNRSLRNAIARNGALVTEYYPGCEVRKANFPIRNRLIAASSLGTVVVEASVKSGALITANCAAEYGKDVFAVPGEITDPSFDGGNRLIRDGAKPVFSAFDILSEYEFEYADRLKMENAAIPLDTTLRKEFMAEGNGNNRENGKKRIPSDGNKQKTQTEASVINKQEHKTKTANEKNGKTVPSYIDEKGKEIYNFIVSSGVCEADEIIEAVESSMGDILASLTSLEIAGLISKKEGNKYYPL